MTRQWAEAPPSRPPTDDFVLSLHPADNAASGPGDPMPTDHNTVIVELLGRDTRRRLCGPLLIALLIGSERDDGEQECARPGRDCEPFLDDLRHRHVSIRTLVVSSSARRSSVALGRRLEGAIDEVDDHGGVEASYRRPPRSSR